MTQALLPGGQIAKLERLIHNGKTGLLKITFNRNEAVLCLERGQIGYLFYKGIKGLLALSQLCKDLQHHQGLIKTHFDPVPVSGNDPFLSLTETVLMRLKGSGQYVTQSDIRTDNGHLAPIPGVLLTDNIKSILQNTLGKVVGSHSRDICRQVFQTTRTLRVAVEALANEMEDEMLAQTFRDSVREQIAALDPSEFSFGADELSKAEVNAAARAGVVLNDGIRTMIADVLPLFVGQRAQTMCQDVFASTTTLRAALDHLTSQMNNPESARQFIDLVRKRLVTLESHETAA